VYVWNLWIFRHELFDGAVPLKTLEILPLGGPTDLSLHNYTIFADLLAVPLLGWFDLITTFNVIYILNIALAGFGMYLLARRLTGGTFEAFLAGLIFCWAPFIVTRGAGHYSLVGAAPLPFFMLALHRAWDSQRLRDAVLAGVVLAWAAFSDPYYAVYSVVLAGLFGLSRMLAITFVARPAHEMRSAKNLLHVSLGLVLALIVGIHFLGGGSVEFGPLQISVRTLYTPMLLLTVLVLARVAVAMDFRIRSIPTPSRSFLLRAAFALGIVAAVLMSPTLYAVGVRVIEGRMPSDPVLWRSSAQGVDLLAFFVPNPNHPLAPSMFRDWLADGAGGFNEQVASLSWVGALAVFAAWRLTRFASGKFWPCVTLGFAVLSLGPFLTVAGLHTHIPGPWAILRYVPIVGAARMPGRMSIVVMLGFCVVVAMAFSALTRAYPRRRGWLLSAAGVALLAELMPVPRTLYSAEVPRVYQIVAADPRPVRVLTLPTGIRDGLAPIGNFDPATQYYQAFHGKGLIGGYLSRVSDRRKQIYRQMPVMGALLEISEGRKLPPERIDRAIAGVGDFLDSTNLGYVVMNKSRTTDDVRDFATILLGLEQIAEADGYELYVPRPRPVPY
jgi:hypothetical protein